MAKINPVYLRPINIQRNTYHLDVDNACVPSTPSIGSCTLPAVEALRLMLDLSRRPMTFSIKEMIAPLLAVGTTAALSWMILSMFVDKQRCKLD